MIVLFSVCDGIIVFEWHGCYSQAVIPEKGTTEYGLTQQMYEISDQEIQTDTNFSFEVSLSDRLEYGLSVYDETNMVMGISAQVSDLKQRMLFIILLLAIRI